MKKVFRNILGTIGVVSISAMALSTAIYIGTLSYNEYHHKYDAVRTVAVAPDCDEMEYQITLEDDGAYIWDGARFVGFLKADDFQAFDQLMINDNR